MIRVNAYLFKIILFVCLVFLSDGIQHAEPNEENLGKMIAKPYSNDTVLSTTSSNNSMQKKCQASTATMNFQLDTCISKNLCKDLKAPCLKCAYNHSCVYGAKLNVSCQPLDGVSCEGEKKFEREMICRYCYQTDHWEHSCIQKGNCNTVAAPKKLYKTNCSVKDNILCLGCRQFFKNLPCNWTGGYKWSTAVILSITLGGFGADRFYLGHWQEGIGKLFSFGGLGVWTLIDVILISLRYLGPADGSLYI